MKQLHVILVSAVISSLLTALFLHEPLAVNAGTGGVGAQALEPCAAENGDVNADGKIDLADPITILGHLFQGSPTELVRLCEGQAIVSSLPDTGQYTCYNFVDLNQGAMEVPCDLAMCKGQDAHYATGCPSDSRFTDKGDGTVIDHCTGLMWQKETADVNGDGQVLDDFGDAVSWCDALAYCESLSFAGHADWRLPNVRELGSIINYSGISPPIDPVFGAFSYLYWSSTSHPYRPDAAGSVNFVIPSITNNAKSDKVYVRAVRSGP